MTSWCGGKRPALFAAVVARDGMICQWCGCVVQPVPSYWRGGLRPDHATLDHVTPRSAGGSNVVDNLVMCCHKCNTSRSRQSGSLGPITEAQLIELMTAPLEKL